MPVRDITQKVWMYQDLGNGLFGNTQRYWTSRQAVEDSGYRGEFSLRSQEAMHPIRLYHVPYEKLDETIAGLSARHRNTPIIYCESPPEHLKIIQGELQVAPAHLGPGLVFDHTFVAAPMRLAFDQQRLQATGLRAKALLETHLDPKDIDELYQLLEMYPGHVIEFSTFRIPVGTIPNRRTLIWEVRLY